MTRVIESPAADESGGSAGQVRPAIRTETVYVVFTAIEETMTAVRVAQRLAGAMGVPMTVVHFRTVPLALPVNQPTGVSPATTETFIARLREEGVDARVRVYLCRDERRTVPFAFRPHSLIVMAGQHRWWPSQSERRRRTLEAAGHFVVMVDPSEHEEAVRA